MNKARWCVVLGLAIAMSAAACSSNETTDATPDGGREDGAANDGTVDGSFETGLPANETGATDGSAASDGTSEDATQSEADAAGRADGADGADVNNDGGTEGGCVIGTLACGGQQPQICTASGTWQNVGAPCSGTTPVCLGGACVTCSPGDVGCNGSQPETCSDGGVWQTSSTCTQPTPDCSQGSCECSGTVNSGTCETCGVPANCVLSVPVAEAVTTTATGATLTLCAPPVGAGQCVLAIDLGHATVSFAGAVVTMGVPMEAADLPVSVTNDGGTACAIDVGLGTGGCNGNTPSVSYISVDVQASLSVDGGAPDGGPDGGVPVLGCDVETASSVSTTIDTGSVPICGSLCESVAPELKSFIVAQLTTDAQNAITSAIDNRACLH